MLIKNAFNITKDDAPYIDEDLEDYNIDDLVNATLERKKEAYFNKLQQEEIKQLRREVEKYRKQDYLLERIHSVVTEHMQTATFQFTHSKKSYPKKQSNKNNRKMLEVPIFDLHLGKMAWSGETGENYDYKIAKKRFFFVLNDIIERVKGRDDIEKIVFPVGSDFFNFDTLDGTTTIGTKQDNDLRWQKLFAVGVEILIKAIDMLTEIAPVEAFLIPGNHDKMTSFYAIQYLYAWYRDNGEVVVNHDPKVRKYIRYGSSLIGFTHGDKEKKRLSHIMQVEAAEHWGKTKYREWHMGHFHSEKVREEGGIIFRNLSSITGTDVWHYESGYVGAVKKHQSFVWDYEKGLSEILITNIDI